jgi:hypothetical protein
LVVTWLCVIAIYRQLRANPSSVELVEFFGGHSGYGFVWVLVETIESNLFDSSKPTSAHEALNHNPDSSAAGR